MGQIPSSPEGDNLTIGNRKNKNGGGCDGGLQNVEAILTNNRDEHYLRKTFLKLHTPDRDQKCILEPAEVRRILESEADEILSRSGLVPATPFELSQPPYQSEHKQSDSDDWSGQFAPISSNKSFMSETGFHSETAPSEFTTMTGATTPMSNTRETVKKRRSKGSAFSVMSNLNGQPSVVTAHVVSDDDNEIIRGPSGRVLVGASTGGYSNQPVASKNIQRIHKRRVEYARRNNEFFHDFLSTFVSSCVAPKNELELQREAYMSVLHLQMKAQLGYYYLQRYLPVFPTAPAPHGYKRTKGNTPIVVVPDDSSSSSSGISQHIEYAAIPPSTAVTCSITDSVFMDLAVTGSLGLVPRSGNGSGQGGRSPRRRSKQKSPEQYVCMVNRRSGLPIAVCALKSLTGLPVVRIYATKQRVPGQLPAATTKQVGLDWADSLPLFAWAEIVTESMYPDPLRISIYMAAGSDGRFASMASYRASLVSWDESPVIQVVGRTDKEVNVTGCALISIEMDAASQKGGAGKDEEPASLSFHIDVSQGIDPALLICFTSVVDEIIERSMRLHCRHDTTAGTGRRHVV